MDLQTFFNIGFFMVAGALGWVMNRIFTLIDRLDRDVRDMPSHYVLKSDYRSDMADIKQLLIRIESKLEHKVDK